MSAHKVYTSDTHLGHANIIKYCRRPFASADEMDAQLIKALVISDRIGRAIYHAGDISFNFAKQAEAHGWMLQSGKHTFLYGNHDRYDDRTLAALQQNFAHVVGTPAEWERNTHIVEDTLRGARVRVLLSHAPQRDLQGCDVNVHGHIHNNLLLTRLFPDPDRPVDGSVYEYTLNSPVHFNASVELHDYVPVTLEELFDAHRTEYAKAFADLQARALDTALLTGAL